MEITPALLEKYQLGTCTPDEKKAVEKWLDDTCDVPKDVPSTTTKAMSASVWTKVSGTIATDIAPTIPLYRKVVRYAAAACILCAVFFAGRFSVDSVKADPVPKNPLKDHLFIFGGDEAQAHILGESFEVKFDGTIKLYNSGFTPKTIQVGDTSIILSSQKKYYLTRSFENPKLRIHTSPTFGKGQAVTLSGDFSIHRLDK